MKFKRVSANKVDGLKICYYIFPLIEKGEFYVIQEVKQKFRVFKLFDLYTTVKFNMFLIDTTVLDFVLEARGDIDAKHYREGLIKFLKDSLDSKINELSNVEDVELSKIIKTQIQNMIDEKLTNLQELNPDEVRTLSTFLESGFQFLHAKRQGVTTRYTLINFYDESTQLVSLDVVKTKKQPHVINLNSIFIPHDILQNFKHD